MFVDLTLAFRMQRNVKLVVVGDNGVGKTALLIRHTDNTFIDYAPTTFEHVTLTTEYQNRPLQRTLYDTCGDETYDRLRPLSYVLTDVFLLCFSCVSRQSTVRCLIYYCIFFLKKKINLKVSKTFSRNGTMRCGFIVSMRSTC